MPDIEEMGEFNSLQKAAIVITSIGAENASEVYKRLGEDDVEKLTFEVASLPFIDINEVDAVLN